MTQLMGCTLPTYSWFVSKVDYLKFSLGSYLVDGSHLYSCQILKYYMQY